MDVSTVIAIMGGVLFLVGLIGGGIEIQSARMPRLSVPVRAIAMLLGLGFVALAIMLSDTHPNSALNRVFNVVTPAAIPATVTTITSPQSAATVLLTVASSSTKQPWMEAAAAVFQATGAMTSTGRKITVRVQSVSSGGSFKDLIAGKIKPVVWSPGSDAWVEQLTRDAHNGQSLMSDVCAPLIYSPLGIAMWRPMAEALGWPDKPISWRIIVDLAADPQGWKRYGHPEWGLFYFGHAHPKYGNSGLLTVASLVYGITGKSATLNARDVYAPVVETALRTIAQHTAKYGVVTEDLVEQMTRQGPAFLHAVATYESEALRMNLERKQELRFPVAFIFPAEGTFWGQHPYCILDQAEWVTAEQTAAAQRFRDFLLGTTAQNQAIDALLRPLDQNIAIRPPLDLAHGTDPQMTPARVMPLAEPKADVSAALIDLFLLTKRKATLLLVLDISGSMAGEKIQAATEASAAFLRRLQGEDVAGLLTFNHQVQMLVPLTRFADVAETLPNRVLGLLAQGNTALHEAVCTATRQLQARQSTDRKAGDNRLYGLVLLSDGADTQNRPTENELFATCLPANAEAEGIKIFPIAFGQDANIPVLKRMADVTGGKLFRADPDSIERVYLGISAEQ